MLVRKAVIIVLFLNLFIYSYVYCASNSELASLENRVFQKVNAYRLSQGLTVLKNNGVVAKVARQLSERMACGRAAFSHAGAEDRFDLIRRDVTAYYFAENLFYCERYPESQVADKALEMWIKSRGHKANMLGEYDQCGVGMATDGKGTYYCTQLFIR